MTYGEYISYHLRGDAGVEERMIASLCRHFQLNEWDSFRLIYYYTMTYHIPSALDMLIGGERDIKKLQFRTDRRYVRCNGGRNNLRQRYNYGDYGNRRIHGEEKFISQRFARRGMVSRKRRPPGRESGVFQPGTAAGGA